MSRKLPSETEITYRVLEELEAFQGVYWKQVQGEFHGAFDEVAICILLSDATELPRPIGVSATSWRPASISCASPCPIRS